MKKEKCIECAMYTACDMLLDSSMTSYVSHVIIPNCKNLTDYEEKTFFSFIFSLGACFM